MSQPVSTGSTESMELRIPELGGRARLRRRLAVAVVLLAVAAGAVYAQRTEPEGDMYRTYPAAVRSVVQIVEAAGRVDVRNRAEVPSPVTGRLLAIHAAAGQAVQAGQLLAELDQRATRLMVRGAEASAQAAAGRVAQAKGQFEAAERTVARISSLVDLNLASTEDLATARAELLRAKAALSVTRAEQSAAGQGVESAQLTRDLSRIDAPVSGIVLRAPERVGAAVGAGLGPLFVIGEPLTTLRVDASVSETEIRSVKPGQSAEILVAAAPGQVFHGTVRSVGIDALPGEGAVLYPVMLLVENPDGVLLPGMTARVRMEVARVDGALTVHEAALRFKPEGAEPALPRTRVWKVTARTDLTPISLRPGISDGVYTALLPGGNPDLTDGDRLVVGLVNPDSDHSPRVSLGKK